jgi:hypothetical protein
MRYPQREQRKWRMRNHDKCSEREGEREGGEGGREGGRERERDGDNYYGK